MNFLVLMFIVFAFAMCARRGSCGFHGHLGRRWDAGLEDADDSAGVGRGLHRSRFGHRAVVVQLGGRPRVRTPARARKPRHVPSESPEQRLQRQFVDGSLTIEEYERELDRLIRR